MSSQSGASSSSNAQSLNLVDMPTEIIWAIAGAIVDNAQGTAILIGEDLGMPSKFSSFFCTNDMIDHALFLTRLTIEQRYEWINPDCIKRWKQKLASANALSRTCRTLHTATAQYLYQHTFHFTDRTVMSRFLNSLPSRRVGKMRLRLYVPLLPVQGHLLLPNLNEAQRILRLMTMVYISIVSAPAVRSLDLVTLLVEDDAASDAMASARDTHSTEANKIFAQINSEADNGFQGRHSLRAITDDLTDFLEYLIRP